MANFVKRVEVAKKLFTLAHFLGAVTDGTVNYSALVSTILPTLSAGDPEFESIHAALINDHQKIKVYDGPDALSRTGKWAHAAISKMNPAAISSEIRAEDFFTQEFEIWKNLGDADFASKINTQVVVEGIIKYSDSGDDTNSVNDDRIYVFVDPEHHSVEDYETWNKKGVVDQRLMYLSPNSVQYWKHISASYSYKTYQKCVSTLEKTLLNEHIKDLKYPFILGAGAHHKEIEIISRCIANSDNPPKVGIVDASFFMLMDSFCEIGRDIVESAQISLYCLDFLAPTSWERSIKSDADPRVFFLLGETIGNINEGEFFDVVHVMMKAGDKIVIGGEFFHDTGTLLAAKSDITDVYKEKSVIDLVMGCINSSMSSTLENLSPAQKREYVDVVPLIASEVKKMAIKSKVPDTFTVFWQTNKDINMGKKKLLRSLILGTTRRYVLSNFIEVFQKEAHVKHLDTIDHPHGEQYSHIIFEKS